MRDDGIFSNCHATYGRDVWSGVKGFALPATSKETAQIISSGLKDFKDLTDGNELHRVFQRLTCAVTAALSPTAGKPGQA